MRLHSGLFYVLMDSVNFGREFKLLKSSGREFHVLGPNILRLFSPNVLVFTLLMTESFFLLA